LRLCWKALRNWVGEGEVRRLDLGIPDVEIAWLAGATGIFIGTLDIAIGVVATVMVAVLALVFSRTKIGLGLRAVADSHAAALLIGIPLRHIRVMVWATAGIDALAAGRLWGARSALQFALVGIALKALSVLNIGGFNSVPGMIVAGLIVGAFEKLAEVYIGPYVGGGIAGWAPCMRAVVFLMFRSEGLFGEHIVRRIRRPKAKQTAKFYRHAGTRRTNYAQDRRLLPIRENRIGMMVVLLPETGIFPFSTSD